MEKDTAQILDEAIARIHAGESVEECLARYPEHRLALEPILYTSLDLWSCADAPLPAELDEWVDTQGLPEFSTFAQQMFPSQEAASDFTQYTTSVSDVLDDVLVLMQTGVSVEECLARYPEHRLALEPLIGTSIDLRTYANAPLPVELDEWVDTTGLPEFVMLAEQMRASSHVAQGRRKYTVLTQSAIATLLLMVLAAPVVDAASTNSLPSDPLYQWKIAREDISLALADSDTRRQLHIDYAERRATEIEALRVQGLSEDSEIVARTFNSLISHAKSAVQTDPNLSQEQEEEVEEIEEIAVQAQDILDRAQNIVDELAVTAPQTDEQQPWDQLQEDLDDIERQLPTARPERVAEISTSTPVPSRTPFVRRPSPVPGRVVTPEPDNNTISTTPTSRVAPPAEGPPSDETEVVPTGIPRTRTPVEPTPGNNPPASPAPTTFVPRTVVPTDPPATLPPTATPVPVDVTQVPRPPTPDPTRIRPTEEVTPTATVTPEPPVPTATPEPPVPTATPEPPVPTATPEPP
ncbi:MAG: DUF5667 domain-containing protein, partial [Chloroflexota bacterium]